jgi:hypothetical protein
MQAIEEKRQKIKMKVRERETDWRVHSSVRLSVYCSKKEACIAMKHKRDA